MAAFADLHVASTDQQVLQDVFQTAIKCFDWLAVNTFLTDLKGKGKKGQQQNQICQPEPVELTDQTRQLLKVEGRKVRQISRLTALLDDTTNTHKLVSPEVQAFDLLAVQPTNEAAFKLACCTLEVDIIVLNMTEKLSFYIKRPLVNLAIERGMHFEILYSPAVRDSTFRQNTISNALQLTSVCKGKNVIVSSGCEKAIELRGPYDLSNLGLLFGLSSPQSKNAVSKNCRAVLKHAEARKMMKSVVGVVKSSQLSPGDQWILDSKRPLSALPQTTQEIEQPPAKKGKT
ncbi:ribonuclease P protein subunit p30-like isoform X2 [Littorina saxatilis]|uniref:ribonuclease P protein subunit p30-like isoform X2 n=1 Tax=Littorina saxatilis TaxID=31220 RepID=UPI0038B61D97